MKSVSLITRCKKHSSKKFSYNFSIRNLFHYEIKANYGMYIHVYIVLFK